LPVGIGLLIAAAISGGLWFVVISVIRALRS
jgi:hypothetical protein